MEITAVEPFLSYYSRLRERTMRLVEVIPPDRLEWSVVPGAFSFGDILRHVAAIERFTFGENALGRPSRYPGHDRSLADGYEEVVRFVESMNRESLALLGAMTPEDLQRRTRTPAGNEIAAWKWLRAMAEHEAHHRGQLYLMLRVLGVPTPPMFGLTSEEVRERSER